MPDKPHNEPVPLTLFLFAITMVLGAFVIVIGVELSNRNVAKTNQFYNRANNCILATTDANERRTSEVEECYDKVEAATGVKGERYGNGR